MIRRSELVTVPSFSPQAAAGSRTCAPAATVSFAATLSETTNRSSRPSAVAHLARRAASETAGLVAITHSALIWPRGDGVEQLHRLEALRAVAIRGACQKRPTRSMSSAVEAHVGGELVGEPADLAPAHGVGLAGQRKRPCPRLADAAGREMAVDDGVDLVGALRGLVHALREAGDGVRNGVRTSSKNRATSARRQAGEACGRGDVGRNRARARQRVLEAVGVGVDVAVVERAQVGEMRRAARRTARCPSPARSEDTGRHPPRWRCGADRSPRSWRRARACS